MDGRATKSILINFAAPSVNSLKISKGNDSEVVIELVNHRL